MAEQVSNGADGEQAGALYGEDGEYHPQLSLLEQDYMIQARERQKAGITKP